MVWESSVNHLSSTISNQFVNETDVQRAYQTVIYSEIISPKLQWPSHFHAIF